MSFSFCHAGRADWALGCHTLPVRARFRRRLRVCDHQDRADNRHRNARHSGAGRVYPHLCHRRQGLRLHALRLNLRGRRSLPRDRTCRLAIGARRERIGKRAAETRRVGTASGHTNRHDRQNCQMRHMARLNIRRYAGHDHSLGTQQNRK